MAASNFSDETLFGGNKEYAKIAEDLKVRHNFDFVAIGLTAFAGAPLKWIYSAGATGERHKRIVLAPGHGIGGIVIKAGKPMIFVDIDKEIDPREYSSYPIVFAEDLRSFCALPLVKNDRIVGSLLCAFRSTDDSHMSRYRCLIDELDDRLGDLAVVTQDFMNFASIARESDSATELGSPVSQSEIACVIAAQEDERKRISRELHDGIAQELLSVSFKLRQIQIKTDNENLIATLDLANGTIDRILDDLHNISVELRPSALDHLGFVAGLRSQAAVFEKTYGAEIIFEGDLSRTRFNRAFETQAYRICQEAILNACKYSDTEQITVRFEDSGGWLHAMIIDTGKGFNTNKPAIQGSGCGLIGMHERAKLIGATLTIESGNTGTTVTLLAPMGEEDRS